MESFLQRGPGRIRVACNSSSLRLRRSVEPQTPPVASVPVTACSVAKTDIWKVSKVNVRLIAVAVFLLALGVLLAAESFFRRRPAGGC